MKAEVREDGVEPALEDRIRATHDGMRRLDRRDWSLWITAITVMLFLVAGVYSFTLLPAEGLGRWSSRDLKPASLGLFGMVLVFAVFAFHKQVLINRLRHQLAGQMSVMASLQTRAELFHKLAVLDPLTGLYNRRFVMQHLPVELARADRQQYTLTALMFDVNGLKQVNDKHSHLAGDLLLREFATALRRAIRSSDMAVRLGGDEFVVILPECGEEAVPRVLARLQGLQVDFRGALIPVAFSAGWAEYASGETPEQLLARADAQLYEDKHTGRAQNQARVAEEERHQAEKLAVVGRLTNGVVHDFNNLLTIITGYTQLVLQEMESTDAARPQIENVLKAAERAAKLTGQLLSFSRKQVLQPDALALNSVIAGMELMLGRVLGKHIQVNFTPGPDLHQVYADHGQMEQLVLNLAANARESMPDGGTFTLETGNFEMDEAFVETHAGARMGSYVRLTVKDTGEGMDSETRSHIFEPALSGQASAKRARMGLAPVYGVVKQNGGYIWVESGPECGNCVSVFLPRAGAERGQQAAPAPFAATADGTDTVMVVESFDSLRSFVCEFLRLAHYNVLEASSGEEAIEIAQQGTAIDLIICDIILPGMSGLEVVDCVARVQPEVQVLYLAGYAEDALLFPKGIPDASRLLAAPFDPQALSHKVTALLKAKGALAAASGN